VKIIYVDMDDTVAECDSILVGKYNMSGYGDNITLACLTPPHTRIKKEVRNILRGYIAEPGFFFNLPVVDGCRQVLLDWHRMGHFIYFVTKPFYPSKTCFIEKLDWVDNYFPWLGRYRVIFLQEKNLLSGDVMIDDRYSFMLGFKGRRILFDLYHRRNGRDYKGVEIATTWEEVKRLVNL